MFSEVSGQHHRSCYFYEFRRLELTNAGYLDPRALAINLQTDIGNEDQYEKKQSEDVEGGSDIEQLAVIRERDRQHGNDCDRKSDQLFDPVVLQRQSVTYLSCAKADQADREERKYPVEIANTSFMNDCYHLVLCGVSKSSTESRE